jgi:hypothetical protein
MGFNDLINFIKQAESVSPGVANRATRQLNENINYLKSILEQAELGQKVVIRNQTVSKKAKVGQPVYLDLTNQSFALAKAQVTSTDGELVLDTPAHVWGLIEEKNSATSADIVIFGYSKLDISNATDGSPKAGQYYLGTNPGRLTQTRPAVSIGVLRHDGGDHVFVNPRWPDLASSHTHHRFDLTAEPAGDHTPPAQGDRHQITNPDTTAAGWLPASSFDDSKVPDGAQFGYNLQAHPALNNAWPPLPAETAYVEWLHPDATSVGEGFKAVPPDLVRVDRNGIWWMTDCYNEVPWPNDFDSGTSDSTSESASACPVPIDMQLRIWFTQPTFMTDTTVVTSLESDDDRLKVLCQSTDDPATKGPLRLVLDLGLMLGETGRWDPLAIKTFDAEDSKFHRGPNAEGIYTESASVSLTGEKTTTAKVNGKNRTIHYGRVRVDVDSDVEREIPVSLVSLDGAEEESFQGALYLALAPDQKTGYRARIHVPTTLAIGNPKLKLRFRLFARETGNTPDLTLDGRRIQQPGSLASPQSLPTSDSTINWSSAGAEEVQVNSANSYFDVETEELNIAAGDDFLFSLERDGPNDNYSGWLGVLRQTAILVPGS